MTATGKVAVCVVLGVSLLPVRVTCGTPAAGYTCMPAPDPSGYIEVYYEVEPLLIAALEFLTSTNLPVYYQSGRHRERV